MAQKTEKFDADAYFGRNPGVVARNLRGKVLIVNKRVVIIREAIARDEEHCHRFRSRPLFREENPADVYAGDFLGHQLLFIRTKPGTCIQINKVELGGKVITGAGNVGKILGLTKNQEGSRLYDGTVCTIKWKGYGKRKKRKKQKK